MSFCSLQNERPSIKSIENIFKVLSNTNILPQELQIFKIMTYMIADLVEVTYETFPDYLSLFFQSYLFGVNISLYLHLHTSCPSDHACMCFCAHL